DQGYLIVPELLNDDDLQPLIDEISEEIDRLAQQKHETGELEHLYKDEPFETRLAHISEENPQIALSIWNGALAGPAFLNTIAHPKLLDIAEQFCGPEIIASSVYRLRPKVPTLEYQGAVPWHQDSGYVEGYCDDALILTVWMPLVDANVENGCLWVIPGVHREGILEHARRDQDRPYLVIPADTRPDIEPVPCEIPKGGALLLHNLTPHASFSNNPDRVRWSIDMRYQSAELPTNAPITRLEHEIVGGTDDVPPACFPPEADFLVRSTARPDEVVTDPEKFERLRKEHMRRPVTPRWHRVVDE
ncbi:MAG: phytanoyl-CoA dioxygenase family protein, partial [Phycisphaeraceae bacterium]|nr:phytanoyl-CoA dioxygenase family protein [Phycisphaeraceae bacterium]